MPLRVGKYYSIIEIKERREDGYYICKHSAIKNYSIFGLVDPTVIYTWLLQNETNCFESAAGLNLLAYEKNTSCLPTSSEYSNANELDDFFEMRRLLFQRSTEYYEAFNAEEKNRDSLFTIDYSIDDKADPTDELSNDNGLLFDDKLRAVKLIIDKIINNLSDLKGLL